MLDNILPLNHLTPGVAWKIKASAFGSELPGMPRRLLLLGQVAETAAIETGEVTTISTTTTAEDELGRGSMLYAMWQVANDNTVPGLPIDVIALHDDPSAVAATGSVNFTADSAKSGRINLYIGGIAVRSGVGEDATAEDIAQVVYDRIQILADDLPVTVALTGSKIDFTCKWQGATGNDIDIRNNYYPDDKTPQGVGVQITPRACRLIQT